MEFLHRRMEAKNVVATITTIIVLMIFAIVVLMVFGTGTMMILKSIYSLYV